MNEYPEHKDPQDSQGKATAPYNFVPLPRKVYEVDGGIEVAGYGKLLPWITHDRWVDGTLSGWIELGIETLTPLFVRDFARQKAEDAWDQRDSRLRPDPARVGDAHPTPPFSAQAPDGMPLIPGSSLRGMTRALVEILSCSKIAPVSRNRPFFRTFNKDRVGDAYGKRLVRADQKPQSGFLRFRNDGWLIEPCPVYRVRRTLLRERNIWPLPVNADDKPSWQFQRQPCFAVLPEKGRFIDDIQRTSVSPGSSYVPATLVITGATPHSRDPKHPKSEFVFLAPTPDAAPIPVPDAIWRRFHDDDQLTQWQENAFPIGQPDGVRRERKGWLRDGEPVFYLCDPGEKREDNPAGLLFLGRSQMFRFPYDLSAYDLTPPELRTAKLDLAEAMFGRVAREPGTAESAIKGRLRFEDAVTLEGQSDMYEQLLAPRALSSPKPTTYPHYLVQDGTKQVKDLATYLREDRDRTTIRGHKLYWHRWGSKGLDDVKEDKPPQRELLRDLQADSPPDTQHTIIWPVRACTRFAGRVCFENLTPLELGALLTALHLPDECAHKLGMAKPLGFGSIRIKPTLHLICRSRRYASWLDDGASEDDGTTYRRTFADEMLRHSKSSQEPRFAGDRGIWQIVRLAALYLLLRWDGKPPFDNTIPMGLDEFKQRKVLPTPIGVDPNSPSWMHELAVAARIPQSGEQANWVVLQTKSKTGKLQFQLAGGDIIGVLLPESAQPSDLAPGQTVRLRVRGTSRAKTGWNLIWDDPDAPSKPPEKKGKVPKPQGGKYRG